MAEVILLCHNKYYLPLLPRKRNLAWLGWVIRPNSNSQERTLSLTIHYSRQILQKFIWNVFLNGRNLDTSPQIASKKIRKGVVWDEVETSKELSALCLRIWWFPCVFLEECIHLHTSTYRHTYISPHVFQETYTVLMSWNNVCWQQSHSEVGSTCFVNSKKTKKNKGWHKFVRKKPELERI